MAVGSVSADGNLVAGKVSLQHCNLGMVSCFLPVQRVVIDVRRMIAIFEEPNEPRVT